MDGYIIKQNDIRMKHLELEMKELKTQSKYVVKYAVKYVVSMLLM